MDTKRSKTSQVNFALSVFIALGALIYFALDLKNPPRSKPSSPDLGSKETTSPTGPSETIAPAKGNQISNGGSSAARSAERIGESLQPIPRSQLPEDMRQALESPPPELPEDLKAQLTAPPPELPEDLKRQLASPPPELPEDLKAQLESPPPPLPEDIKKALETPPRIVSIDEVNTPPK